MLSLSLSLWRARARSFFLHRLGSEDRFDPLRRKASMIPGWRRKGINESCHISVVLFG